MSEEIKIETTQKTRRAAIKTAAQVAVTAPAAALLLSASVKSAMASTAYSDGQIEPGPDHFFDGTDDNGPIDDAFSGNT